MQVSEHAQAVLLLTSHFTKSSHGEATPLSTREWGKLAYWLKDQGLQPSSLLFEDSRQLLSGWIDSGITRDRIEHLLGRGGALGLVLEKWQRAGLWVLTRSDSGYPERLKRRLKSEAPPVLFGCGSRDALNKGGIAVVGSRNASADDLAFATRLGADAAAEGLSVVSGAARGVDETAMQGALRCEGTAVGVLADSLLRSAMSAKYRNYLMSNDLALISPFNPEAGFNAGNAMARNRLIYCLADAAVVVATSRDEGGTWNGANENLRSRWTPLWVKTDADPTSGSSELVRRGARPLPSEKWALLRLLEPTDPATSPAMAPGQFSLLSESSQSSGCDEASEPFAHPELGTGGSAALASFLDGLTFYEIFLHRIASLTAEGPLGVTDLRQRLDVSKTQIEAWLKRAVEEDRLEKLTKPVRYRWKGNGPLQASLFGQD